MRLFLAIPLDDAARQHAAAVIESLRELRGVKWVRPENLHVTLKFIGEVADAEVPKILEALTAVPTAEAFTLAAERLAFQPKRGPARLVAAEMGGDVESLARLHEQVDAALANVGVPRERRALWPHVTLGRMRNPVRVPADLASGPWPGPTFAVDRFELVASDLRPAGPVYTTAATFPLNRKSHGDRAGHA